MTNRSNLKVTIKRVFAMLVGLYLASTGVNFTIKAEIGTSPLGCCPAVFSEPLGVSVGTIMGGMCIAFVLAQIAIFKKNFPPFQIFQLAVSVVYGFFTDLSALMIKPFVASTLLLKGLFCAIGIVLLAFGIAILIRADVLMLAPDAMLVNMSKAFGWDYGKIKIVMDSSMVIVAAIGSLLIYQELRFIGIGTIAAAIFVGMLCGKVKKWESFNKLLDRIIYS